MLPRGHTAAAHLPVPDVTGLVHGLQRYARHCFITLQAQRPAPYRCGAGCLGFGSGRLSGAGTYASVHVGKELDNKMLTGGWSPVTRGARCTPEMLRAAPQIVMCA